MCKGKKGPWFCYFKLFQILPLLLVWSMSCKAQFNQFSYTQYADNLTPLNPAYSLSDNEQSMNFLARKQSIGITGAPTTFLFNANFPLESLQGSSGLFVRNDAFAVESEFELNGYIGKSVRVSSNGFLGVSLNFGIKNYVANFSSLDPTDPAFANDIREIRPNVGFGVIYYSDWLTFGLSVPELTINTLGAGGIADNNNFRNNYYFYGSVTTNLSDGIAFRPATLFSYSRGVPLVADISGTLIFREVFELGMNFRTNDELAGMFAFNIDRISIGYSYQFGTNSANLGGFNNATNEVTLKYRFGKQNQTHSSDNPVKDTKNPKLTN